MNNTTHAKIRLVMALRQAGITDTRTLSAMERTPRELFVPAAFEDQAYEDTALPIGLGQTISQPYVVAVMTQALDVTDRDKVLEVGTGSGYQASVLARMCRRLYTVERHSPFLSIAENIFDAQELRNITAMTGDGMKGWAVQAPFDKIIVTAGAMNKPPQALLDQLKVDGIMVIPVGDRMHNQTLKKYTKLDEETYSVIDICPVRFVQLLPNVVKESEYIADDFVDLPTVHSLSVA